MSRYQWPMAPPESAYALWYYPGINRFSDEEGKILHDLSDLFSVWQLDEWKRTQEYDVLLDRKGDWCELYYASECEELDFLNHTKFLGVFREYDLLF